MLRITDPPVGSRCYDLPRRAGGPYKASVSRGRDWNLTCLSY
jgi:hypothetical protein